MSVTSGQTTINSNDSYTGGTTVSDGTLTLAYNPGGNGGASSVPGVLTIQPGGTVNATGNALGWWNVYTPTINISGGAFNTGFSGLAVDGITINMTGGTLGSFNGGTLNFSNAPQNGPGTEVNVLPSTVTSVVSAPGGIDLLVTQPISWQIIKTGSSTMALAAAMTGQYPIVSNGALIAQTNDAFGPNGVVLGDSNTTLNNGSPSVFIDGPYSITKTVTVDSNATTGTYTIGGNTSASSSFSGGIAVNNNVTFAQASGGTLNINCGVSPTVSGTQTITFAGPGAVTVATLGLSNSNNGNISNGSGVVAVAVSGGLVTFSNPNSYTGGTTVSGGTLALAGSFNTGQYSTIVGALNISAGGMADVQYNAFGWWNPDPMARLSTVNINGGLLQNDSGANVTLIGTTINMTGGTVGTGNSANGYTFYNFTAGPSTGFNILPSTNTAVISAPLHPNTDGSNTGDAVYQIFNVSGGSTASGVDLLVTAPLGYVFLKRGNGTMELAAQASYGAGGTGTLISAGTVIAGANDPLGGGANVSLGDSVTTLNNSSPSLLIGGPYTLSNWIYATANPTTGIVSIGGNTAASSTFSGRVSANNNLSVVQASGGTVNVTGGIVAGSGAQTITFAGPGTMNVNTTAISNGAGTIGVDVSGGELILNANDTYMGGTDVVGGTLEAMNSSAIPYGSGLSVGTNGTVEIGAPSGVGAAMVARSFSAASPAGAVAAVPEPGTLLLLTVAALAAALGAWRRRKGI